jgi:hypothetical protein
MAIPCLFRIMGALDTASLEDRWGHSVNDQRTNGAGHLPLSRPWVTVRVPSLSWHVARACPTAQDPRVPARLPCYFAQRAKADTAEPWPEPGK